MGNFRLTLVKKKIFSKVPRGVASTLSIVFFLVHCGTQPRSVARVESMIPAPSEAWEEEPEYRLRYGDVLDIKFLYHPELNETLVVRPDGRITVPALGDVRIVGHTPMQVDSLVTEGLSRAFGALEVSVIVRELGVQNVYVLGEVGTPGEYPLMRRMTVLQALAAARGHLNTAELKSVLLIRRDPGGRPVAQQLNLTGDALESGAAVDPILAPLDIVYVPKTFIAQVDLFLDQYFARLLPPLYLYLAGYQVLHPEETRR